MSRTTTPGSGSVRPVRLPGQAAAPEGPVDLAMMYLVHHAFRRDLADFTAAVPRTPVEDGDTWQALTERWALFCTPLHHHHHAEDTWLWPWLLDRAGVGDQATVRAMETEHAELDPALEACTLLLDRLTRHPDQDARAALSVRLTAAKEGLSRHLAHEETDTLALLQRLMTQQEWEGLEAHFEEGVTLRQVRWLVPWVLHGVPAEQREGIFARTGPWHRVLWRLSRPRFDRLQRRAFRYLPA
jgi:iron-sulfur cluster repair protein YtfE (RIC family)